MFHYIKFLNQNNAIKNNDDDYDDESLKNLFNDENDKVLDENITSSYSGKFKLKDD